MRRSFSAIEPLTLVAQRTAQFGHGRHVDGDPARFVLRHAVGRALTLWVLREVDVGQGESFGIHDLECLLELHNGPRRGKTAEGRLGQGSPQRKQLAKKGAHFSKPNAIAGGVDAASI